MRHAKVAPHTGDHAALSIEPIGYVRVVQAARADAARQPVVASGTAGRIELLPGRNFEHALDDLAGWEYIWVIFRFHLNGNWRPKVLPPRSTTGRKGVFATRSPHRPNALGLSAVRLERVDALTLHIGEHDMLDGTPVLDIKPYVAYTDAHPSARSGWLDDTAALHGGGVTPVDPIPRFEVAIEERAGQQAAWIEANTGFAIGERIRSTLSLGPEPHAYRRIRRNGDTLQLAVKEWRVRFSVDGRRVRVIDIHSGYRAAAPAAHREFSAHFAGR